MPSSITRLVALDHERLLRLLRRATATGPSRQRWRDELVNLSRAHLVAEDEALRAGVLDVPDVPRVDAADLPGRARLDSLVDRIATAELDDEGWGAHGDAFVRELAEHAAVLDEQMLAPLQQALPRKEIRRLGGTYAQARDRSLREQGEADPPPRRLDLSRAELYELAKKAGIEGRSSMSRRDLIERLLQRKQTR